VSAAPDGPATTIVRSRVPDVVIPDMSVTDYIFRNTPDDADRVAIVDGVDGAAWTRGELLDRIRRLAGGLAERGIGVGSTVALVAGNSPEFAVVFHGVLLAGATLTPINPTYGPVEIAHQLDDADADLLIVSQAAVANATAAAAGRPVAVIGDESFEQLFGSPISHRRPRTLRRRRAPLHRRARQGTDQVQRLPGRTGRTRGAAARTSRCDGRRGDRHTQVGELPMAFVVARPGATVTAEDVISYVAARVASYKKVRRVEFVTGIPRSAAGKILRRELRPTTARLAVDAS
jgi:acyl-CoA synthetase (AMP-forming)/AMP-acid ligase II